jgi:hypothetical protein
LTDDVRKKISDEVKPRLSDQPEKYQVSKKEGLGYGLKTELLMEDGKKLSAMTLNKAG